jgi:hypothetical protein
MSRATSSVSGEIHGNFVARLVQAGVRALNRDPSSLAAVQSVARALSPVLHADYVSPVVKEKSYFAPSDRRCRVGEPCRGADLRQRGDT